MLNVSCATAGTCPAGSARAAARLLVFLAGPHDPGLRPDDGIIDATAVDLAVNGMCCSWLTVPERLKAATRILASGATVHSACARLRLPDGTEAQWARAASMLTAR